ncbi:ABC transporter ATP-binding protein [Veillonella seminalis]|uniref:ABC transporter ATP-binding protein n=1 Tax=Veillonella seminalis TaxID=1502943 RepID=UPI00402AC044
MTEPIILLKHLRVTYEGQTVLQDVNLTVAAGEAVAIVGPSGAGKTTILKTLLGLLPPQAQVSYEAASLCGTSWPESETAWHNLRGRRITYVAQGAISSFSPFFTIEEQSRDLAKAIGLGWPKALARIESLSVALDLPEQVLSLYPSELSGGMAQRVALLFALLPEPDILVADEPAASLDMVRQLQVAELLKKVQCLEGLTLVFVTHQRELAECITDTIYELRNGKLESDMVATPEALRPNGIKVSSLDVRDFDASSILEIKNLSASFDSEDRAVLHDVSLTLKHGEWVALVGLSGAGKSTLFRCLLAWQPIFSGEILYNQKPLQNYSAAELGQVVQPIWQDPQSSFNPRQTIGWSLEETLKYAKNDNRTGDMQGLQPQNVKFLSQECTMLSPEDRAEFSAGATGGESGKARIAGLLATVNLPSSYSKRYPHMLSGGECQRAALARAIAGNPSILLCDEMTSALDGQTQADVIAVLNNLKQKNQLAGLVITHDLAVVEALCEYIYLLDDGRIVEEGPVQAVLKHPQSELAKQLVQARSLLNRK